MKQQSCRVPLVPPLRAVLLLDSSHKKHGIPCALQVAATLPFGLVYMLAFSGVWYGMGGLRSGAAYFFKFYVIVALFNLIACQVSDLNRISNLFSVIIQFQPLLVITSPISHLASPDIVQPGTQPLPNLDSTGVFAPGLHCA